MNSSWRVPLSSVSVTQREIDAVLEAVADAQLSGTAGHVSRLEAQLGVLLQRQYVIAVNSGTSALELALEVLGTQVGDEVIVPATTFAAPAAAARRLGAEVVLCDVLEDSWTIDPRACERLITKRTRAIIAVDVFGQPCDFDQLNALGPPVIEDACEAHGAVYRGRPCGSHGQISVMSFHANKTVAFGEGGALLTDSRRLADLARLTASHGMNVRSGYLHDVAGHNFRMANLVAAFGTAQVGRWTDLTCRRQAIAERYREGLAMLPVRFPRSVPGGESSCWLFTAATSSRDALVLGLRSAGIDARGIWPSLHRQPFLHVQTPVGLPVSSALADECFWLPTFHEIADEQIDYVISRVRAHFDLAPDSTTGIRQSTN